MFLSETILKNSNYCLIALKLFEKAQATVYYLLIVCLWLLTNEPSSEKLFTSYLWKTCWLVTVKQCNMSGTSQTLCILKYTLLGTVVLL